MTPRDPPNTAVNVPGLCDLMVSLEPVPLLWSSVRPRRSAGRPRTERGTGGAVAEDSAGAGALEDGKTCIDIEPAVWPKKKGLPDQGGISRTQKLWEPGTKEDESCSNMLTQPSSNMLRRFAA